MHQLVNQSAYSIRPPPFFSEFLLIDLNWFRLVYIIQKLKWKSVSNVYTLYRDIVSSVVAAQKKKLILFGRFSISNSLFPEFNSKDSFKNNLFAESSEDGEAWGNL